MTKPLKPQKDFFSESEAADCLRISILHLHSLLDEYIFNDGSMRPSGLTFSETDLVLLDFWMKSKENPKVIRMPRRN